MGADFILNLNRFSLLIALVIHLGLALFIYFHNRKSEVSRAFGMMLFSIVFWIFSFTMLLFVRNPDWVLFYRRLAPAGASFIAAAILYFSMVFPATEIKKGFWFKLALFLPAFIVFFESMFTNNMVEKFIFTDVVYAFAGRPVFGPFYYAFAAYFMIYFFTAMGIFFRKYRKPTSPVEKMQVWYVLFGIFSAGILALLASLLLPLFGISELYFLGPLFTIISSFCISYAIVRYRLLSIEEFLLRIVMLLAGITAMTGTFLCLAFLGGRFLIPLYVMIANITLGLLVYLKNVKNPANRLFMFLTFAVFLWAFSVLSYSEAHTLEMAFLWSKVSAFFALLIGILSFYFSFYFPKKFKELNASIKAFLWSLLFVISGLIAFNLVVSDVRGDFSAFSMIIGPFFWLYCLSFVFYMSGGLWILYDKYRKYTGLLKMQIRYVFLGFFLGTAPPLFTNLIFPLFGNSSFADYGPFFTVITLIFIAYSIVRHRLMGIEFVVQRGITYSLLSVFAMFIYGAMLFLVGELMRGQEGGNLFFVIGLSSVILAITFQPILRWLEKATDKFFFKGHYDYQRTIQEVSQAITSVIKLEEIVRLVVRTLTELMRVKEISFLVLERERGKFKSIGLELEGKGSHYKIMEIDEKSPIVSWIKTKKDVLVDDEIESNIAVENEEGIKRSLKDVYEEIERLELVIWVPIISRGEIVGLIVLGEKLSGDIFTSEDVRLLKTLGNQIAVGIENTALYEEVLAVKNYAEDILMSMSNGILTTDLSGGIVTFNYMAEKLTGLSSKNVIGKSIKDVFGADSIVVAAVESTLKDRCYSNFETVLDLAGGGKSMVSISSTLLRDNYGKRMGGLISLTDVSEVKELQGKVQQADKLAALGTMAAGMAHEIKNPLSSMKVLTQLLPLKFEDLEYRQKFSEIMPREIERIDRIVESLLGFARAASPKFEKIRIEAVMSDTLEYYKRKMEENSVKLDLHQEDVPPIIGDFGQLSQVFSNLVLNAIQVMQGGGVLKVVIRRGKRTSEGIDTVAVEVSDTGKGMDKETLSKLFDPFYTTKYGGTGLGLTISHSIVSGHRGFIDVKSEVGKGTAFTVILPVTQ